MADTVVGDLVFYDMNSSTKGGEDRQADSLTPEEADLLDRSKCRGKDLEGVDVHLEDGAEGIPGESSEVRKKSSYRDTIASANSGASPTGFEEMEDGEVSDDDIIKESSDATWFGIGMMREEKIEARLPWSNSLIIKLVGRPIGYHFLWKRIQAMWKTQGEPLLIDLGFDFYIVKLARREEYERALFEGPWMIGENYLHVQRWKSNFCPESEVTSSLLVWIRFPLLPVEYYKPAWLKKAADQIGHTIRVDHTTMTTVRGKFARVCVEVDFSVPLKSHYRMRGKDYRIQYEGLHDICFSCGKYGHREGMCPLKRPATTSSQHTSDASTSASRPQQGTLCRIHQ